MRGPTHWAAVALFLCPYDTRAFVTLPTPWSNMLTTTGSVDSHTHGHCHRRASLRLEAGVGDGVGGAGAGGGESGGGGGAGDGEKKAPRSVLQRPWDVEVDLHGVRHIITVQPGDSILEAAEMSGMNLSYECRRGSCISCAAKVQDGSSGHFDNNADRLSDDGAPDGFVLTCSTYPTGPGVKLELSANIDMWLAFCTRFDDIDTQAIFRQASAGLMRKYRVEHPEEFREEVERQFQAPEA